MSILVTGGTGLLGSHISRQLVKQGEDVVIYDVAPSMTAIYDVVDKVRVVPGDLIELGTLVKTIKDEGVDRIIHTAAFKTMLAERRLRGALEVNVEGPINVLEAARITDVKRVVHTSTAKIYGQLKGQPPYKEEYQGRPVGVYAITKLAGELFGDHLAKKYGIDFRVLRIAGVLYGTGTVRGGQGSIIREIVEKSTLGMPVRIELAGPEDLPERITKSALGVLLGRGDRKMDMIYAKDAARCHIMLMGAKASTLKSRAFNLGAGNIHTVQELAEIVKKIIPEADIQITTRPGITLREYHPYDLNKAREEFGYASKYDLQNGVTDYIKSFRKLVEWTKG